MGDSLLFHSSDRDIESVFGKHTSYYILLSKQVLPHALKARYYFEDHEIFEQKSRTGNYKPHQINQIYWRELLFRAHISVSSSLLRTCRLMDATAREYGNSNLPGWASCARALIESVGDSVDILQHIPITVSENYHSIAWCIGGKEDRALHAALDLEEKLIEFIYARKLKSGEKGNIPESYIAKPTRYYIETLEKFQIGDINALYSELCELSHPAAASVQYMFSSDDEGRSFCIRDQNDRDALNGILKNHRSSFEGLMMVAFNSIFISFWLLDGFDLFPRIPPIRKVDFSNIPLWKKVEDNLKSNH